MLGIVYRMIPRGIVLVFKTKRYLECFMKNHQEPLEPKLWKSANWDFSGIIEVEKHFDIALGQKVFKIMESGMK